MTKDENCIQRKPNRFIKLAHGDMFETHFFFFFLLVFFAYVLLKHNLSDVSAILVHNRRQPRQNLITLH